jgi:hypothetical protein
MPTLHDYALMPMDNPEWIEPVSQAAIAAMGLQPVVGTVAIACAAYWYDQAKER